MFPRLNCCSLNGKYFQNSFNTPKMHDKPHTRIDYNAVFKLTIIVKICSFYFLHASRIIRKDIIS